MFLSAPPAFRSRAVAATEQLPPALARAVREDIAREVAIAEALAPDEVRYLIISAFFSALGTGFGIAMGGFMFDYLLGGE